MSTIEAKKDEVKNRAGQAVDKAKEAGSKAVEVAGDVANTVGQKATDFAKAAGEKADHVVSGVGEKAQSAADAVRQHGPSNGVLGSATKAVADTIEQGGKYLEKEGLSGMMGDVTDMIKRNPVPALLVGIGLGYLLSRALDRS